MKRLYLVALLGIGALALAGCKGGGVGGNPEVTPTAVNEGADLKLTWKSVEGVDGYRVYCDGNKIWEGKDTTYTIQGSSKVCKEVEVSAYSGSDEQKTKIDLTPKSSDITDLVSHDSPTGNSWVELNLPDGSARSVNQDHVRDNAGNAKYGFFIFFREGSKVFFKDPQHTSVGPAAREVAFTATSSGYLAPGTGNYNTSMETATNAYHFFWVDQGGSSTGNSKMDNDDYFGVIKVRSISGGGPNPYTANLAIYIQYKVPGLRWVKF